VVAHARWQTCDILTKRLEHFGDGLACETCH